MRKVRLCSLLFLFISVPVWARDIPGYVRKSTWYESMLASVERLQRDETHGTGKRGIPNFGLDEFTIMAWIQTRDGGTIVSKAPKEGPWQRMGKAFFVRDGKLCFDIGCVGCVTSKGSVNDGQWHHVAVSSANNVQRLYIDGCPEAEGNLKSESDVPEHVLKIGYTTQDFPAQSAWKGALDEVRIYGKALPEKEIRRQSARFKHRGSQALAACWPFDQNARDVSGNDNNGRINPKAKVRYVPGKEGKALWLDGKLMEQVLVSANKRAEALETLWEQLARDFPAAQDRQEMKWEREDGIWNGGWKFGDWPGLAKRYAEHVRSDARILSPFQKPETVAANEAEVAAVHKAYVQSRRDALLLDALGGVNTASLRRAVEYLAREFGPKYPNAELYLNRIQSIEARIEGVRKAGREQESLASIKEELLALEREALLTNNPLIDFDQIIFNKRKTFQSTHYYTDYIDGFDQFEGKLCAVSLKDGTVREFVPPGTPGLIGRYDLSYDAKRVVFDCKPREGAGFRIHEMSINGKDARQLTQDPPDEQERIERYHTRGIDVWAGKPIRYTHHTDDLHPCYLPGGGFCFVSTRCEFGILCDGPDVFTTSVLYRMDADGGNMIKLSNSSVSESAPSIMNDGRILYTRWEYVDKGAVAVKCLWAVHPDGSGSVEVFGNDIDFPDTCNQGRAIPGSNNEIVYIGAPHMPLGVGTVIRIDTNRPIRTRAPMTYVTPEVDVRQEWGFNHNRNGEWAADANGPLYMDAYPLSDSFFLVACNPGRPWNDASAYAIYLIDTFGNRVEVYRDQDTSCWQPMPLRPRIEPPALPSVLATESPSRATIVMNDVYEGLPGIERGSIKYLRIMEQVPRPWTARRFWSGDEYDQQHAVISMNAALGLKVLHGVVSVEEDGSACFTIPADKNIFFQALDEDFMEVQRMRTYINARPGETRSCVGCHGQREQAPWTKPLLAMQHRPQTPIPQPGDTAPRPLHYPSDVQPVLDRHCVRCHGESDPKGGLDLSGAMTGLFSHSYENLLKGGLVQLIGENHPKTGNIAPVPPKTLGSYASKLVSVLRSGHQGVEIPREEFIKLLTWVDSNAQYYGSYYGRRNLRYEGLSDFRPVPTLASALGEAPARLPQSPEDVAAIIQGGVRHPFLVSDHSGGGPFGGGSKLRIFSADGKLEWEYPCSSAVHETWVLPNGNILFVSNGVREVTRDKRVVFEYKSDLYITTCQRLPDGNTLIGENPLNRVIEVDPQGAVVKTVQFAGGCADKSRNFRLVRKLGNGNYLVAHEGEGMVREYDGSGTLLKEFKTPGGPYAVVRLANGNTLVSCGAGKEVVELDAAGRTVWELKDGELPGIELHWMAGLQRLPNGNTVMTCWFPCTDYKGKSTPQILEVTPDKRVVWTFSAPDLVGMANNIQLLDVPGDVTKGEVLR